MNVNTPLDALHGELRAASPDLVGNDDLLRGVLAGCGDCIKVLDLDGRLQFMSEGGKRVMEVEDFSLLKGCPWPAFWVGEGNVDAALAVETAKAGGTGRFRGPANTAKGNPRYWDVQVSPIFGADGKPAQLLSISRDITEEWQKTKEQQETAQRERFLTQELEHRVKNIFALVLSVANQTFRGEAYAAALQAFSSRTMALAKAHEAAKEVSFSDTPILDVIEAALSLHRSGEGRFKIAGPLVKVSPRQTLSISLAVNELATNALKYGALSVPGGKVDVSWAASAEEFVFAWREQGGPAVVQPSRQGFGSRIIKDFMANDFGGVVQLSYDSSGVVCELKTARANLPG
jgi:two-component sensor histidine kinase